MPMPYAGPLGNNVLETANAPGTAATINLGGAPSGWTGFVAAFGTGRTVFYFITDGVQSEWGTGLVTAGSLNTLSRGVAGNTQGTTQRLNFTGAVQVYNAIPAEWQPFFDVSNGTLPMGGRRLSGLGAGTSGDDGARLDQVAWRVLGNVFVASAQGAIGFSLPNVLRFRLEWEELAPAQQVAAGLYLRYSYDGGATYFADPSAYATTGVVATATGVGPVPIPGHILALTPNDHVGATTGEFSFSKYNTKAGVGQSWGRNGANSPYYWGFSGWTGATQSATHVLLGFVNQSIGSGHVRLLGSHA